jgi:hypothetical protein
MQHVTPFDSPPLPCIAQDNSTKKLLPARNWLHVEELPTSLPAQDGQPGTSEPEHRPSKCAYPLLHALWREVVLLSAIGAACALLFQGRLQDAGCSCLTSRHDSKPVQQGARPCPNSRLTRQGCLHACMRRGLSSSRKMLGALVYTLRVEDPEHQTAPRKAYTTICPQYVRSPLGMCALLLTAVKGMPAPVGRTCLRLWIQQGAGSATGWQ